MPVVDFGRIEGDAALPDLLDAFAKVQKALDYLMQGGLDSQNIRAKSIVADRMSVAQLSAIAADLGHITAGLIEAVKIIGSTIIGSYIATAEGTYPRTEMSTVGSQFAAYQAADKFLKMDPSANGTSPGFNFQNGVGHAGQFYMSPTDFAMLTPGGSANVQISSGLDLFLSASNVLKLSGSSLTMDGFTGYNNSFQYVKDVVAGVTTYGTVTVKKGIITSVV